MTKKLLFLILLVSFAAYSQTSFESGYYITNTNQKIEGLIRNLDWKNNPDNFVFKKSENENQEVLTIETVTEFGIYNKSKYVRQRVNIDRSSDIPGMLSMDRRPDFKEEELFLKVLVEGKANLYSYEDQRVLKFFYSADTLNVEQLVYKRYVNTERQIFKNNTYIQQLWNNLKCPSIALREVEQVNYKAKDLWNFFTKYNTCHGFQSEGLIEKPKGDLFNITVRTGLNSTTAFAEYNSEGAWVRADFGQRSSLRIGVEVEVILPFNNNKWSLFAEPTYQYYKATTETTSSSNRPREVNIDYRSIEVPVGLRHYFFLNSSTSIFVNGGAVFDFPGDSNITSLFSTEVNWPLKSSVSFVLGAGIKINNLSLEGRYLTGREFLDTTFYVNSNYKTISIILGYTIF